MFYLCWNTGSTVTNFLAFSERSTQCALKSVRGLYFQNFLNVRMTYLSLKWKNKICQFKWKIINLPVFYHRRDRSLFKFPPLKIDLNHDTFKHHEISITRYNISKLADLKLLAWHRDICQWLSLEIWFIWQTRFLYSSLYCTLNLVFWNNMLYCREVQSLFWRSLLFR